MIMDEGLCNAEVIGGRGSLTCWLWLCEGLGPEHCKCVPGVVVSLFTQQSHSMVCQHNKVWAFGQAEILL